MVVCINDTDRLLVINTNGPQKWQIHTLETANTVTDSALGLVSPWTKKAKINYKNGLIVQCNGVVIYHT